MFDTNNNAPNPFTLPKMESDSALSSLEALSTSILLSKPPHESNHHNNNDTSSSKSAKRTGRWTLDEKILFLYGLRKFGKGRWKKMSAYLPDRSLVQIKSHAQKVLKRLSEGEHVFRRLEENGGRLHTLLAGFNEVLEASALHGNFLEEEGSFSPVLSSSSSSSSRRKRRTTTTAAAAPIKPQNVLDGREHIIAASALCQLAAPKRDPVMMSSASVTLPAALAASFFCDGIFQSSSSAAFGYATALECALRGSAHVTRTDKQVCKTMKRISFWSAIQNGVCVTL